MANPTNRQEFGEYCLRRLGRPVLEINISAEQIDDCIDAALQYYQTYHCDATTRAYGKHVISLNDVTNRYITLPDEWISVNRVLPFSSTSSAATGMWSAKYQLLLQDIYDIQRSGEILTYEMGMQYLNTLDMLLNGTPSVRWTRHANRLHIDAAWGEELVVDDVVVVDGLVIVDPAEFAAVWNDLWLKKYAAALMKRDWGQNMIKFEGIQMPGGVVLNGRQIYEDAMAEIEKLEAEADDRYQLPIDMQIG